MPKGVLEALQVRELCLTAVCLHAAEQWQKQRPSPNRSECRQRESWSAGFGVSGDKRCREK